MRERKKSKYRLLAAAIIVLAAGAVLAGVAFAAGAAKRETWAKIDTKLRAAQGFYETAREISETFKEEEGGGFGFTSLDFDLSNRDLVIEQGTGEDFELAYAVNYEDEFTCEVKGGALALKQNKYDKKSVLGYVIDINWVMGFFDGWETLQNKIVLTVPAGFEFENVNIKCTSGNMNIENIKAKSAEIKCSSGDIKLSTLAVDERLYIKTTSGFINAENTSAQSIEAECSSGDIKLNKLAVGERLYVKTTSGFIKAESVSAQSIEAECSSGDVTFAETAVDEKLYAKTTSGFINIENTKAESAEIKCSSGDLRINNLTAARLDAGLTSGFVSISASDIKIFVIKVSSGDVSFKNMPFTSAQTAFSVKTTSGNIRIDGNKNGSPYNSSPAGAEYKIEAALTSGNFIFK